MRIIRPHLDCIPLHVVEFFNSTYFMSTRTSDFVLIGMGDGTLVFNVGSLVAIFQRYYPQIHAQLFAFPTEYKIMSVAGIDFLVLVVNSLHDVKFEALHPIIDTSDGTNREATFKKLGLNLLSNLE